MARGATRECYAEGCDEQIARTLLMCPRHWWSVPKPLRDEVYASLKEDGVLSQRYLDSIEAAKEAVANG